MQCRAQSERFGTQIFSETVERVDLSKRPFKIYTEEKEVEALSVIIATGEPFPSSSRTEMRALEIFNYASSRGAGFAVLNRYQIFKVLGMDI